jgi:hypothetical protein
MSESKNYRFNGANFKRLNNVKPGINKNMKLTDVIYQKEQTNFLQIELTQVDDDGTPLCRTKFTFFRINTSKINPPKNRTVNEVIADSLRELALQLHSILVAYLGEDAAFEALDDDYQPFEYQEVDELLSHRWSKEQVMGVEDNLATLFVKAYANVDKDVLLWAKVLKSKDGSNFRLPRFGAFVEKMEPDATTTLKLDGHEASLMSTLAQSAEERKAVINERTQLTRPL